MPLLDSQERNTMTPTTKQPLPGVSLINQRNAAYRLLRMLAACRHLVGYWQRHQLVQYYVPGKDDKVLIDKKDWLRLAALAGEVETILKDLDAWKPSTNTETEGTTDGDDDNDSDS